MTQRRRRRRKLVPTPAWGLIGIVAVAVAAVIAYTGPSALEGSGFQLHAIFTSDAQLAVKSQVRIAGVPVGTVTGEQAVSGGRGALDVTMSIQPNGLPLHADATAQIRPRLVLEGNFYVDLHPGTPGSPLMRSDGVIPASRTSGPVQLDRLLTSLGADTRANLQQLLRGLGAAVGGRGSAGNAPADPRTVGQTAGQALHATLGQSTPALRDLALTSDALQGQSPHDLTGVIAGSERVFSALAGQQAHLSSLIVALDRTMAAFAAEQSGLQRTVAMLPGFLSRTDALDVSLSSALPPTTRFATSVLPGLRQLPATVADGNPWITEASLLFRTDELGGLIDTLMPTVRSASSAIAAARPLVSQLDLLDRCLLRGPLPTGDQTISDPPLTSGGTVWQEALHGLVGVLSTAQNFDGNGFYVRGETSGGPYPVLTSNVPSQGPLRGNALFPPLGTRPAWPGQQPLISDAVACANSPEPNLNSAETGPAP